MAQSFSLPPALLAQFTFPAASYLTRNISDPALPEFVSVTVPKLMDGLEKDPATYTHSYASATTERAISSPPPPALLAHCQLTFWVSTGVKETTSNISSVSNLKNSFIGEKLDGKGGIFNVKIENIAVRSRKYLMFFKVCQLMKSWSTLIPGRFAWTRLYEKVMPVFDCTVFFYYL